MIPHLYTINCKNCLIEIPPSRYYGLQKSCEVPLCIKCYSSLKHKIKRAGKLTCALYFLLREKQIPAQLEEFDGYKTIDISIANAKLHIEVDGDHHNIKSNQALSDLKRTYYSIKEGIYTLRIPNSLVRDRMQETTNYVIEIIKLRQKKAG